MFSARRINLFVVVPSMLHALLLCVYEYCHILHEAYVFLVGFCKKGEFMQQGRIIVLWLVAVSPCWLPFVWTNSGGITSKWTGLLSPATISSHSLFYFPVPALHNFKRVFCETCFCPLRPSSIEWFNYPVHKCNLQFFENLVPFSPPSAPTSILRFQRFFDILLRVLFARFKNIDILIHFYFNF